MTDDLAKIRRAQLSDALCNLVAAHLSWLDGDDFLQVAEEVAHGYFVINRPSGSAEVQEAA